MDVLIKRLQEESWINNIEIHDSHVTLGVEKGDEKIPTIIEIAQSKNIKIQSISVRKPTLDDVFLHFTGRSIREQETTVPIARHHGHYPRRR